MPNGVATAPEILHVAEQLLECCTPAITLTSAFRRDNLSLTTENRQLPTNLFFAAARPGSTELAS
jgi:hypothetical protein